MITQIETQYISEKCQISERRRIYSVQNRLRLIPGWMDIYCKNYEILRRIHTSRERTVLSNISSIGYYASLTDTPIEDENTDLRRPVQTESSAQDAKIDSTESLERRTIECNVKIVVRHYDTSEKRDTSKHPLLQNNRFEMMQGPIPDKRRKSANLLNLRYESRYRRIVFEDNELNTEYDFSRFFGYPDWKQ